MSYVYLKREEVVYKMAIRLFRENWPLHTFNFWRYTKCIAIIFSCLQYRYDRTKVTGCVLLVHTNTERLVFPFSLVDSYSLRWIASIKIKKRQIRSHGTQWNGHCNSNTRTGFWTNLILLFFCWSQANKGKFYLIGSCVSICFPFTCIHS